MTRTSGKNLLLQHAAVLDFFEQRAARLDDASPLVSVLYQDRAPELVEQRDAAEKARVVPLLGLDAGSRVLDIGCGVGRWAPPVVEAGAQYVGTDFSPTLVEHARRLHPQLADHFHTFSATQTHRVAETGPPFTHVLVAGVTMYLDDDEYVEALGQCAEVSGTPALLYLREVMAADDRLTLSGEWSSDMGMEYHAIYRTEEESFALADRALTPHGLRRTDTGPVLPEALSNRTETYQRFSLWRR